MIQLKNVSKSFGAKKALSDVTLSLEAQKTHVFLGSSGSGKSTLLKILMGLIPFSEGDAVIAGLRVNTENQRDIKDRVGYVLQEGGLFPHLTLQDNICLKAKLRKWNHSKIEKQLHELSELFGLDKELLKKYPRSCSGGQRQRAAVMRGLFLNPDILMMDEPFGALDPLIRYQLQEDLKKIFNQLKKTVIIVTHDLGEAEYFGHTVTLFSKGKIVQHGDYSDLIERPANNFVTQFVNAQRISGKSND